jgi:glutamine synthetase
MFASLDDFLLEHPLTDSVDLLLPDLSGIPRGKRIPPQAVKSALAGEGFFTTTLYALDTPGANVDQSGLVWEEGDADRPLKLDIRTLRPVPWRPGGAQIVGGLAEHDGAPFFADPRQVLAGVAARFADLGLTPVAALEFEFYLVDKVNDELGRPLVPHCERLARRPLETEVYTPERMEDQEAFFELADRYCTVQELPIKGALCEFAPGQFEINLGHGSDMVEAADQGMMLKRCVKAAARATGQRATFMAKPFPEQSGSGLHVHLSLVDRKGRNLFGETETENGERLLRHGIWGLQTLMAESMLVFAPNANSYRRLRPLTYAPTAPTWGWNNRTVALRIPPGSAGARRIEHRVAGSDANPYLVLAAVLAGVLHGLEQRGEPADPVVGNAYAQAEASLPLTWEEAITAFRAGETLKTYFGERFCRLFAACREAERNRFHARVTPTEYEWYLTAV